MVMFKKTNLKLQNVYTKLRLQFNIFGITYNDLRVVRIAISTSNRNNKDNFFMTSFFGTLLHRPWYLRGSLQCKYWMTKECVMNLAKKLRTVGHTPSHIYIY